MKKLYFIFCVVFGALYLANPSFGVFELLPDNIPFFGNLDEAGAMYILLYGLGGLGFGPMKKTPHEVKNKTKAN